MTHVFIKPALEQLLNTKDIKASKYTEIRDALKVALESELTPQVVLKPFALAALSRNPVLVAIAVDYLGKLFSYGFWGAQDDPVEVSLEMADERGDKKQNRASEEEEIPKDQGNRSMSAQVIDVICEGFYGGEATDDRVQLQIIKSLSVAVCTADASHGIHGAVLLQAIRSTYNIFLLSKSPNTQIVAQTTLSQMIDTIFGRLPKDVVMKEGIPDTKLSGSENELGSDKSSKAEIPKPDPVLDLYIKDAYLVFKVLCKLSMKTITVPEGATDLKSHGMRSKLLALHLLHCVLIKNISLFFVPAHCLYGVPVTADDSGEYFFIHAVKQFLCLSLSRNAASVVPQVFDVAIDIFCRVLFGLRQLLKKELSVLFTEIIIPIIEAKSTGTYHQRLSLLKALQKFFSEQGVQGGKILVEIYLNYDCDVDAGAHENLWERLVAALSKVITLPIPDNNQPNGPSLFPPATPIANGIPSITTNVLTAFTKDQVKSLYAVTGDFVELRKRACELLVTGFLEPLLAWSNSRKQVITPKNTKETIEDGRMSEDLNDGAEGKSLKLLLDAESKKGARMVSDDASTFEGLKHRKNLLAEGIRRFNFKPKKGMKFFLDSGCIASRTPQDIAKFLLTTDGLSKVMIGEFLGEGEEENIAIMHAFVDEMEFSGIHFTAALRQFLQSFRLPGEAQKIDRFMLKFAERYVKGNPHSFSTADTAYVLAYSVIMLNTDQHNAQVKKRMTKQDFLKNNRGIDEGKDLSAEFLEQIFDEISTNEIVMKDQVESTEEKTVKGRKDVEQATKASENMANKTEAIFNTILKSVKTSGGKEGNLSAFYSASQFEHVKSMFEIIWMSVLTGISGPLQETEDIETIWICLDGFKYAIRISCAFDMELEKKAFMSTLSKFAQINAMNDLKSKSLEAIKVLFELALVEGNHLGETWRDVLNCISHLERLQLLGSQGEQELQKIQQTTKISSDKSRKESTESTAQSVALAVDKIFVNTSQLSGTAIVDFVRCLCQISWEEITSSLDKEHPRMYSLQRLVEISYYNMKRIRVEWSNIWAILGDHFNQVGCHSNSVVGFFALDKLRQLAMKFLEIEELPNFKFQKDFLRPFEYVVSNSPDPSTKDMVLACLLQMVQSKSKSMKSGWKAIFAALSKAARETHENIVLQAYEMMKTIFKSHFESVMGNAAYSDFTGSLVEFCKNLKFTKTGLHSVEMLKNSIPRIAEFSNWKAVAQRMEDGKSPIESTPKVSPDEDPNFKFWFPILFGLYEVIMTCDLEVRTRALTYLFETLKTYGSTFPRDFWEVIAKGVLFPIFDDLKLSKSEHSKFANKEDMSVWLSTTLIQALRQFVDLFTFYYETLNFLIDGLLDLLAVCLTQDNETLARIGSTCLQQLIESNLNKFSDQVWEKIAFMFSSLFESTMPTELFDIVPPTVEPTERTSQDESRPKPQKKDFQPIIFKCVLHLLVIQTLGEILNSGTDNAVYKSMKSNQLLKMTDCLETSYRFAAKFNADIELRTALHRMGFMKQMPNLLKQETVSVSTYIGVLVKMYTDTNPERVTSRNAIADRLVPLSTDIFAHYNSLDTEAKRRDLNAWRPVVVTILNAFISFEDKQFKQDVPKVYPEIVKLLLQEMTPDIRYTLHAILVRLGTVYGIMTEAQAAMTPIAPIVDTPATQNDPL